MNAKIFFLHVYILGKYTKEFIIEISTCLIRFEPHYEDKKIQLTQMSVNPHFVWSLIPIGSRSYSSVLFNHKHDFVNDYLWIIFMC